MKNPSAPKQCLRILGGQEDKNMTITRRMLFLLESHCLSNNILFETIRQKLIKIYVSDDLRDDQICMFLLNDIIRYWRTICVDFEYKTLISGKPRAIRLIKLRFSRMLLYFAGVLAVAETYGKSVEEKRKVLATLFEIPPAERVFKICGGTASEALEKYAYFIVKIDDPNLREGLESGTPEGKSTDEYIKLRKKAHDFRIDLFALLENKYDKDHPIHLALQL